MLETLSSLVRETRSMLWITDTADIYTYSYRPFTYTSCFQLDTKTGMHSRKGCVPLVKIPTTGTLALTVRRLALPRSSLLLPTSYVQPVPDMRPSVIWAPPTSDCALLEPLSLSGIVLEAVGLTKDMVFKVNST